MGTTLQEECEKFGSVKSVHIPRPSTTNEQEKPGVGFVFVAFDAVDSAAKAAASLRARTFDGRKVCIFSVYRTSARYCGFHSAAVCCIRVVIVAINNCFVTASCECFVLWF